MSIRRDRDNFRSHPSSYKKRIKQEKKERIIKKQRGAFDRFLCKTEKKMKMIMRSGNLFKRIFGIISRIILWSLIKQLKKINKVNN